MASVIPIQRVYRPSGVLGLVESRDSSGLKYGQPIHISSLSHNPGSSALLFRHACDMGRGLSLWGSKAGVVRCAVSKQKKKVKEKKQSADKQWKFDELMLVWDDAFQKFCDDRDVATSLLSLCRNGCSHYGRGCVLMEEAVSTKPRGAASGFSNKSRYSSNDAPELPFYVSLGWKASYVPLDFINDPLKAPELSPVSVTEAVEGVATRLVDREKLLSVLKGMDRTRLQGLLADPTSEAPQAAGEEEPYDPSKNDMVVMFALVVDGQQAVGADVLRAYPAVEGSDDGEELWTLQLRDGDGSDLIP